MKTYAYKQKLSTALIGLAISAPLAIFAVHTAANNDRGLLINHLIHLSRPSATVFWWLLTLPCVLLFACCVFLTWMALTTKRELRLLEDRLEAPRRGFSRETVVIPYRSMHKIEMQVVGETRFLYVHHRSGRLTLVPAMLPKKSDLDEIHEFLRSRSGG